MTDLRLDCSLDEGVATIALEGELDLASAPALEEQVERLLSDATVRALVFDLRTLAFMDSTGLRCVIVVDRRVRAGNRRFALVPGVETVQRVFEVTGMSERLRWVPEPRALATEIGPRRVDLELPGEPDSVGRARNALEPLAGELAASALDDVRLLVSELVTNAIRHSRARPGARVRLLVELHEGHVRVEVHDRGTGFEPRTPERDPERAGGWGLYLVGELAERWGVDEAEGARVWFELPRAKAS